MLLRKKDRQSIQAWEEKSLYPVLHVAGKIGRAHV